MAGGTSGGAGGCRVRAGGLLGAGCGNDRPWAGRRKLVLWFGTGTKEPKGSCLQKEGEDLAGVPPVPLCPTWLVKAGSWLGKGWRGWEDRGAGPSLAKQISASLLPPQICDLPSPDGPKIWRRCPALLPEPHGVAWPHRGWQRSCSSDVWSGPLRRSHPAIRAYVTWAN